VVSEAEAETDRGPGHGVKVVAAAAEGVLAIGLGRLPDLYLMKTRQPVSLFVQSHQKLSDLSLCWTLPLTTRFAERR